MQILHVLPQYFIIDGREKVHDPRGMHGIRLEVQAHIILGAIASVQDLITCCEQAGVAVDDVVLEQLASAAAVLSEDERKLGVGVLDIGGGTSDLAIYHHGSIRHTMVLPVAGNHFTNDLAIGLRITLGEAERIKKAYGCVNDQDIAFNDLIEVEMVQGNEMRVIRSNTLVRILRPRAQEVLSLVHEEIIKRGLTPFMATGMVLTGGGALLGGMKELAEEMFDVPVRIGHPRTDLQVPDILNSPMYATGYGLLLHTLKRKETDQLLSEEGPLVKRVYERMKSWVLDFF
jgi:cell division protein FtsA